MKQLLLTLLCSFLLLNVKAQEEASQYSTEQVYFIIKVKDAHSKEAMQAQIEIKSISEGPNAFHGKGNTNNNGTFELHLVITENVRIKLQKEQYMPLNEVINFKKDGYQAGDTVVKEFLMEKLEIGKFVTLDNVQFETGKVTLKPESADQIETLLMLMNSNPKMEIELAGHTDNTGGKTTSLELSEQRVEEVKRVLVEKGIHKKRIKGVGYGGTQPVASNRDEEGRTKNRRVEFKIIKID